MRLQVSSVATTSWTYTKGERLASLTGYFEKDFITELRQAELQRLSGEQFTTQGQVGYETVMETGGQEVIILE
jgi:transcriptional accessory protein Tex/SPT6